MSANNNGVVMTQADFGVCLAALVQTESYWNHQLLRHDGEMPGGFTREEVGEILGSIRDVKVKIESIFQMNDENEDEDHVVVS